MPNVIGVILREAGKIRYYEVDESNILPGDKVVVETKQGTELAEVVSASENMTKSEVLTDLRKIKRKASEEDLEEREIQKELEIEAMRTCQEKISKHGLEMKMVDVECLFDDSKLVFYFCAESRVDFRELVKDLASTFKKRIELKQIGVRDEAKMIGGLGSCGRRLCCNTFLKDFEPVSIKFAKEQKLPLNPFKISGICGRLMCCLRYEYENYKEFNKRAPKYGACVKANDIEGKVREHSMCKDSVVVETDDGLRHEVPVCECRRQPCSKKEEKEVKEKTPKDKKVNSRDKTSEDKTDKPLLKKKNPKHKN